MGRGNLIKYYVTLDPSLYPSRVAYIDLNRNDVDAIYIDSVESTANLNKVYIRIEENDWVPAFAIIGGVESKDPKKTFKYLYVRWDSSQDNYRIVFLFSDQGLRLVIPITNYVIISADNVGLAKDSTVAKLTNALASVGADKLRVSAVDALPRSPFTLYDSAGNELSGYVKNIDTALSILYKLIKFNRAVSPAWTYGSETTAPVAGTSLVSKTVSAGKTGYVYGVFISAGEANDFKLTWTSGGASYSIRIPFSGKGALQVVFDVPINEGLPADGGSTISLTNVDAGSAGVVYQAGILYAEL